jgi:hypothetical protein
MRSYRHADELNALLSPRVAAALASANIARGGFTDVFPLALGAVGAARRGLA